MGKDESIHFSTQAFASGTPYIAALTDNLSWTGNAGQTATVNYTFTGSFLGDARLHFAQQNAALGAMEAWSNVARVTFVANNSDYDIAYSQTDLAPGTAGLTSFSYSGSRLLAAEVQPDNSLSGFAKGEFGYLVFLHEIGHALGLKHPANYSGNDSPPFLSHVEDTTDATVMSYYSGSGAVEPSTPMIYDIAAMQYLYGANTSYNAGNTTYSYNGANMVATLWDGAGTDTISTTSYNGASTIDLREGLSNISTIGGTKLWIAFGANIENAMGGTGQNTIYGNSLGNYIYGYANSDALYGLGGNDTILGGSGIADPTDAADIIQGGAGFDTLYGNGGNDTIYGGDDAVSSGDQADTIYGGRGSDSIYGNIGNDTIYGGGGGVDPGDVGDTMHGGADNDSVFGNGGDDYLQGGTGNDSIYGGADNDRLFGNDGTDYLFGGLGNDTLNGGAGNDRYYFGANGGVDTISQFDGKGSTIGDIIAITSGTNGIASQADALAHISYSGGNAILDLGEGNSVIITGITNGLTIDDFMMV